MSMTEDESATTGPEHSPTPAGEHSIEHAIAELHDHLRRIEDLVGPNLGDVHGAEQRFQDLAHRASEGEHRLPVAAVVAVAIVLQLILPDSLAIHPVWLFPAIEGVLIAILIAANPVRISRTSAPLRAASVSLI